MGIVRCTPVGRTSWAGQDTPVRLEEMPEERGGRYSPVTGDIRMES